MLRIVVSQAGSALGAGDYELGLVRIGSHEDNDLQVEHQALSPHHLEVYLFGKRAYARSPDDQLLIVDGDPVEGRAELRDGQALEVDTFSFQVRIAPTDSEPADAGKTYRSGRVKLKGTELLALPSRDEEQQLMLAARRVLVGQGVDEAELMRLRDGGAERAREIVQAHARDGLEEVAGQLGTDAPIVSPVVTARRAEHAAQLQRALKTGLALVAALGMLSLLVTRVSAMLLSFTP